MFDKKISTRTILINILWALLAVAIAGLVVFFTSQQITRTTLLLNQKRAAAYILENRSAAIQSLRSDLTQVGTNDTNLANAFPADDNISTFLGSLQALATQKSLQANIQVSTPVPTSLGNGGISVSEIDYSITLNGTAVSLIDYLKGFEALPYFAGVRSISITSPGGWDGNSTIVMQAVLYAKASGQ